MVLGIKLDPHICQACALALWAISLPPKVINFMHIWVASFAKIDYKFKHREWLKTNFRPILFWIGTLTTVKLKQESTKDSSRKYTTPWKDSKFIAKRESSKSKFKNS